MLAMASLLSFSLASCGSEDGPGPGAKPSVRVSIGTVTHNAIEVTITPADADKAAYMCMLASETPPTANAILSSGTQVSATAASTITIPNLLEETAYVVYVAASNGDVNGRVSSTPVSTIVDPNTIAPEVDLQVFVDEITDGGVTYHKYDALFYRIKTANRAKEVQIFIDELEVVQPLIDQGNLSELFGESIKGGIPFTSEEVEICNTNPDGFFAVATDVFPNTDFVVVVLARNSKGYDIEYKTVKIEAEPTLPRVESPLFESLLGTYTGKITGTDPDGTGEKTFTCKIIQGLDDQSNEMYRSRNQLIIDGFDYNGEWETTYPETWMSEANLTRNRAYSYWGPKIIMQFNQDGTITTGVPMSYYMVYPRHFILLRVDGQVGYMENQAMPITVDETTGVITIHSVRMSDGTMYYPSIGNVDNTGLTIGLIGLSDLVLTPATDAGAPALRAASVSAKDVKYQMARPIQVGKTNLNGNVTLVK